MTKFSIYILTFFMVGISIVSTQNHSYYMQMLVNTSLPYAIMRGILACGLLAYLINPKQRTFMSSALMGTLGIVFLLMGGLALISPTILGHSSTYYPIGDAIMMLELGIWARIMSSELPITVSAPVLVSDSPFAPYASIIAILLSQLMYSL